MPLRNIKHRRSLGAAPYGFLHAHVHAHARRQRGAIALVAAFWLLVAVTAMGVIDVGNVYLARRDLQRIADMAAVAGAQTIGMAGGCSTATASANLNAASNGYSGTPPLTVVCGRWTAPTGSAPQFDTSGATLPLNAVRVTATQSLPVFFVGPARTVQAVASAKAADVAVFSLSTSIATLSGGLVNGLLNGMLGSNVNLDVGTWQGIAAAQIKLGDLATQLGVATINDLLATKTTVGGLASAMATVLSRNGTVAANVTSGLATIAAAASGTQQISLGSVSGSNGLLSIGLGDPQAAATATISAFDALMTAAEIANGQNAINLGVALNLGALANVTAQAIVLQPPVIAVGDAGQANGAPVASAHAAVVRLYVNVNVVNNLSLGIPNTSITALNLPVYIEAGQGTATLQATQCSTSPATSQTTIVAQPGIASACLGADGPANLANKTSASTCNSPAVVTAATILSVPLLEIDLGNRSTLKGLQISMQRAGPSTLVFHQTAADTTNYKSTNTNDLGGATSGLLTQVLAQLPGALYATVGGVPVTGLILSAVTPVIAAIVTNILGPVLNSLDALLVPLLQLLGVQIGVATVHNISLSCSNAQLVN